MSDINQRITAATLIKAALAMADAANLEARPRAAIGPALRLTAAIALLLSDIAESLAERPEEDR